MNRADWMSAFATGCYCIAVIFVGLGSSDLSLPDVFASPAAPAWFQAISSAALILVLIFVHRSELRENRKLQESLRKNAQQSQIDCLYRAVIAAREDVFQMNTRAQQGRWTVDFARSAVSSTEMILKWFEKVDPGAIPPLNYAAALYISVGHLAGLKKEMEINPSVAPAGIQIALAKLNEQYEFLYSQQPPHLR